MRLFFGDCLPHKSIYKHSFVNETAEVWCNVTDWLIDEGQWLRRAVWKVTHGDSGRSPQETCWLSNKKALQYSVECRSRHFMGTRKSRKSLHYVTLQLCVAETLKMLKSTPSLSLFALILMILRLWDASIQQLHATISNIYLSIYFYEA